MILIKKSFTKRLWQNCKVNFGAGCCSLVCFHPARSAADHQPGRYGAGQAGQPQTGGFLRYPGQQRRLPQLPGGYALYPGFPGVVLSGRPELWRFPAHSCSIDVR